MYKHVEELKSTTKGNIKLRGWVHDIRDLANVKFVLLRDSTGVIQCTIRKDAKPFKEFYKLSLESVIELEGKINKSVVKSPEVTIKGFEVEISDLKLLSKADPLPIQVIERNIYTGLSKRLDYRWIDLRKPKHLLVFKIWTYMEEAMREYWIKNGFIQIYTPKFMSAASESGAELFTVDYFGRKVYLAQSPQFFKQMAMAAGFEKIFEIGPAFRANPSHTSRHDTEFTMIDVEMSFIDSHKDLMKFEEEWIAYTLKKVKQKYGKEIKKVFDVDIVVPKLPFPRLKMEEALKLLKEKKYKSEGDLDSEGEKLICEIIKKKYNHEFVFIDEYPINVRPFYHMRKEENNKLTKGFDLIWKGIEITTGAQREHRPDILEKQAIENDIDPKSIESYLNFFKYGCPPHGGFALSPTRLLILMLGLDNVREATFLPRDTERVTP